MFWNSLLAALEDTVQRNVKLEAGNVELAAALAHADQQTRQLADRLHNADARWGRLLEQSHDAIFLLETSGKVREANPRALELLGLAAERLVGRPFIDLIPVEDRHRHVRLIQQALAEGTARDGTVILQRDDEAQVAVELTMGFLDARQGASLLLVARDLTERNQLEDQFRQAQKMEAVGRLAGGVAHDFNNLLTIIVGNSELLLARLASDEISRQFVAEITKAGERAVSLTRQLLAFSRKQVLEFHVFDLNMLVQETVTMLRRLIGEDIDLRIDLDRSLGHVKADPGQLNQVLMNLAVNARDAMPAGGILTIATHNVDLDESYTRKHPGAGPGRYVQLVISDTGCGMDQETLAHLFEPFFTTKALGKGTGLGLATVFGIVRQSGGHIEVISELGRGSTFRINLPFQEEAPVVEATSQGEVFLRPEGKVTVLVVEDNTGVRKIAKRVLENEGYTVLEAQQGKEAVELIGRRHGPIDLLVTDVIMPQMSGRALADYLLSLHPEMKVLFVTGYLDDAVIQAGVQEGEAFLQKPFTPKALKAKVRELLQPEGRY